LLPATAQVIVATIFRVRPSTRSRLVGLVSVLALLASSGESLAGELRDGQVHHESVVSAASHHDGMASAAIMDTKMPALPAPATGRSTSTARPQTTARIRTARA